MKNYSEPSYQSPIYTASVPFTDFSRACSYDFSQGRNIDFLHKLHRSQWKANLRWLFQRIFFNSLTSLFLRFLRNYRYRTSLMPVDDSRLSLFLILSLIHPERQSEVNMIFIYSFLILAMSNCLSWKCFRIAYVDAVNRLRERVRDLPYRWDVEDIRERVR